MKSKFLILAAFAMLLYGSSAGLAGPSQLGSAQSFSVLGASTVANTPVVQAPGAFLTLSVFRKITSILKQADNGFNTLILKD